MNERKGFLLFIDQYEPIKGMSLEQKGSLLDALFEYNLGEEPEIADPMVRMAFGFFRAAFDRDSQRRENISEKRRAAVNSRKDRWADTNATNDTNVSFVSEDIQTDTNATNVAKRKEKKQEENNINTSHPIAESVNLDRARALDSPAGGDGERRTRTRRSAEPAVDLDGPGMEFVELRAAYDAVRPEGPLDGFDEYKQLKASRDRTGRSRYPGNAILVCDFTERKEAGFWNPGYEIGLARYLKTRCWEQPLRARASPQRATPARPGDFDPERQAQIFRDVLADLEAEDAARAGQEKKAGGPVRPRPELRQGVSAAPGPALDASA